MSPTHTCSFFFLLLPTTSRILYLITLVALLRHTHLPTYGRHDKYNYYYLLVLERELRDVGVTQEK